MPTPSALRVALVPGDGIGPEVVAEGVRVLDDLAHEIGAEKARQVDLGE